MNTINNFDIVEIDKLFSQGHFSLSCGLHESLSWFTTSLPIITTVSCFAILSILIAACLSSNSTTPNNIEAIIQDRNVYTSLFILIKLEVSICWSWIHEEALVDWTSLNTFASSKAITISATLSVTGRASVTDGATSEAEPHWLSAEVSKVHHTIFSGDQT